MTKGINPGIRVPGIGEASPSVRKAIQQIITKIGFDADPTFSSLTANDLTLNDLSASRLISTDADNLLTSIDLADWVSGTSGILTVTDDGDGTVTLNISDLSDPGADRIPFWDESSNKVSWASVIGNGLTLDATNLYWAWLNMESLDESPDEDSIMVFSNVSGGMEWKVGATAREALGLEIGNDVQAHGGVLDDLNTLGVNAADSEFLVGTGAGALDWESGATARTSLGLGTGDTVQFAQLKIDDASTYIDKDGSGNMTFTDAVVGTRTLKQLGCPTHKYIKAATQSEGDLHLSDATYWGVSKALIHMIRIVTTSGDWDLYLLQNDNGYSADDANIPKLCIGKTVCSNANLMLNIPYEDEDDSDEVHLYWIDNEGTATVDIYVLGYELI